MAKNKLIFIFIFIFIFTLLSLADAVGAAEGMSTTRKAKLTSRKLLSDTCTLYPCFRGCPPGYCECPVGPMCQAFKVLLLFQPPENVDGVDFDNVDINVGGEE